MSLLHQSKRVLFLVLSCLVLIVSVVPVPVYGNLQYWTPNGNIPYSDINPNYKVDTPSLLLLDNGIQLPSLEERIVLLNQYNSIMSVYYSEHSPVSTDILTKESHYVMWHTTLDNISYAGTGLFYDSTGTLIKGSDLSTTNIYCLVIYGADVFDDYSLNSSNEYPISYAQYNGGPGFFGLEGVSTEIYYWATYYISLDGITWRNPYISAYNSDSVVMHSTSVYRADKNIFKVANTSNSVSKCTALFSDMNIGYWKDNLFVSVHPVAPLSLTALNGLNLATGGVSDGTSGDDGSSSGGESSGDDTSGDDTTNDDLLTEDEKDKNIIIDAISSAFSFITEPIRVVFSAFENIWESLVNVASALLKLFNGEALDWFTIGYLKDYLIFGFYLVLVLLIFAWLPTF